MDPRQTTAVIAACMLAVLGGEALGAGGPHWVDTLPAGMDVMLGSATLGVDLPTDGNLDGGVDMTATLMGPLTMQRGNPLDDSTRFPGTRAVDGHLDVIDTEIVSLLMTDGGLITARAGAGTGIGPDGAALAATWGNHAEQPANSSLADSFFDVFFEVQYGASFYYNKTPVRVTAVIDGVPPLATYTYSGPPVPLYKGLSATAPEMQVVSGELTTPEPTTMALLALGGLGMLARRRRR